MKIVKAEVKDIAALSSLTKASKGYWGYSQELMRQWDHELSITENHLSRYSVYKLIKDNRILGYYSFAETVPGIVKLENLFIAPDHIGKGLGTFLFKHFLKQASSFEAKEIQLEADPHAEGFYSKLGFKIIGYNPTSITGRHLPVMALQL